MICLSHESALDFWSNPKRLTTSYHKVGNEMLEKCSSFIPDSLIGNAEKLMDEHSGCAAEGFTDNKIMHVLLCNSAKRQNYSKVHNHVIFCDLPKFSLYKISNDVLVVCPELALLQVCGSKSVPEIVKLACELSSSFSVIDCSKTPETIDDDQYVRTTFTSRLEVREPVSSAKAMNKFASEIAKFNGVKKFKRAISYVPNGSAASPMEISLAMLFCMPSKYGGFGLPKPEFNVGVLLGDKAASIYGYSKCVCDLLWSEKKVDLEYNSDAMHANSVQMLRDSERALALESEGYRVISVTKQQLFDVVRAKHVAQQVGKMLGYRIRTQRKDFDLLQAQLLHVLGLRG